MVLDNEDDPMITAALAMSGEHLATEVSKFDAAVELDPEVQALVDRVA